MFSPRFAAYARSQGLAAQQALEADTERYPGGQMTGFILWISAKWQAWDAMHKHASNHVRDAKEHGEFDEWIGATGGAK